MMTPDTSTPLEPETAGRLLRQAREAAGLSLDAVAQQLKLAPRQVEALEDGDYSRLPGRTFVRGFMRNYARLLHLDPDTVLSALPGAASVPSLGAPTLHATSSSIGELPNAGRARAAWTRWAIPLGLIAIVAGAAYFEYKRQGAEPQSAVAPRTSTATRSIGETATALPNPIAAATPGDGSADASSAAPSPASTPSSAAPADAASAAAPTTSVAAGSPSPASAVDDAKIVLTYRDFSWTVVRDATGRVLIAKMMRAGDEQALSGTPPFDVVIGNSTDVRMSYRGQPVDLAPLSRGNVARFTLK